MSAPAHSIGIVGGGASGTLVAAQLARQAEDALRILLFESEGPLGAGLAYGTGDLVHVLNVPAGRMSAWPDQPDHFVQWLNDRGNCATLLRNEPYAPGDFVSRAIYGRYLHACLRDALAASRGRVTFEHRTDRVVDFEPWRGGGKLLDAAGAEHRVDGLVLALGNQPPRDPLPSRHPFLRSARYVRSAWTPGLPALAAGGDVLIIGSGLTAIDVVLSLVDHGFTGRFLVTSRGGRLPQSHAPTTPHPDFLRDADGPATIRGWLALIRAQIAAADGNWRGVIDSLRPHTQAIWQALPLVERRRFLRHVRSFWESHRHRCAPAVGARVAELRSSGRLQLIPGRLRDIRETRDGLEATLDQRGNGRVTLRAGIAINCIGPESNFRTQLNDPLVVSLIERGIVHPDPLFLGLEATPEGHCIGLNGEIFDRVLLIGPPLRGILWETTALPEIRVQAERAARLLLAQLARPLWQPDYQI